MASSFRSIVKQVIDLDEKYSQQHDGLIAKHGLELGIKLGARTSDAYLAEAGSLTNDLEEHLESLDEAVVRKVETLMYFGRDLEDVTDNDIQLVHRHVKSTSPTVADAVRSICEKAGSVGAYLKQAQTKVNALSIDIEGSFD